MVKVAVVVFVVVVLFDVVDVAHLAIFDLLLRYSFVWLIFVYHSRASQRIVWQLVVVVLY